MLYGLTEQPIGPSLSMQWQNIRDHISCLLSSQFYQDLYATTLSLSSHNLNRTLKMTTEELLLSSKQVPSDGCCGPQIKLKLKTSDYGMSPRTRYSATSMTRPRVLKQSYLPNRRRSSFRNERHLIIIRSPLLLAVR
jgi:hypothetical protein